MSWFGFHKELEKYQDVDEDEVLASLTPEELQELERELADIDPSEEVPIGLRQRDQTAKTPTGTFSREALLKYWESETCKLLDENESTGPSPKQDPETEEGAVNGEEECVTSQEEEGQEEPGNEEKAETGKEVQNKPNVGKSEAKRTLPESISKHNVDFSNGLSKDKEEESVQNNSPSTEDPNLKVTTSRPCGNPTVIDEALEKILNNDRDTTEVNLNNIENISHKTLIRFAEALQSNAHVRVFSLANTRADDHVAFAMARALRENSSITNLNVESNFITAKGILALAGSLQQNSTLTELRFHNQRHILGGQAEMEIVQLLRGNTALLKLGYQFDLPGPRMSMTGILTRNQDRRRQRRLLEQRQQGGSDVPVNAATDALQKVASASSPLSSPKLPREDRARRGNPAVPLRVPPPPPSPPPLPPSKALPEDKKPTRKIAEVIRLREEATHKPAACVLKSKPRKDRQGAPKETESNVLKGLKNALKPISEKQPQPASRPSTPQRSVHDNLMADIRGSSTRSLRRENKEEELSETATELIIRPCCGNSVIV